MKPQRDLTWAQFLARAKAYGWEPQGFMGYFGKRHPDGTGTAICVSIYNAGSRRRSQLAYLIAEGVKAETRWAITKDKGGA